ncbi:MAG: polysaccharide biosynthesis C-terminal domain-containing protein [Ignavibacteriaceae bacterium]|nr:polysaccharide biosynthesis C-terminal domain-containing protein [Ignavibacteriaceae bacterium]
MSGTYREDGASVSKASLIVFIIGLGAKGLGFLREIVFAARFGVVNDYDVFLTASVVPLILSVSIFYISQNFIIPFYNKTGMANDKDGSGETLNSLLFYSIVLSVFITSVLLLFSEQFLKFYFGSSVYSDNSLALEVYTIYCILLIPNTVVSVFSGYLLARFDYKNSQLNQVIPTLFIILGSLFFGSVYGVRIIPFSLILGTIFQLGFLFFVVKPKLFSSLLPLNYFSGKFGDIFFYTVMIEVIGQLYVILDRGFIDKIPDGAISSLNYATSVFSLPITLITVAITTVIFPKVSQDYFKGSTDNLLKHVLTSLKVNMFIMLMVTYIFIYFGDTVVRLFFERGKFDSAATAMTSEILIYLTYGLLFYSLYSTLNRVCYGIGKAKFLFLLTSVAIPIKWLLNYFLVGSLAQNGLALATSITYTIFFVSTLLYLSREIRFSIFSFLLKDISIILSFLGIVSLSVNLIMGVFPVSFFTQIASLLFFLLASVGLAVIFGIEPGRFITERLLRTLNIKFPGI